MGKDKNTKKKEKKQSSGFFMFFCPCASTDQRLSEEESTKISFQKINKDKNNDNNTESKNSSQLLNGYDQDSIKKLQQNDSQNNSEQRQQQQRLSNQQKQQNLQKPLQQIDENQSQIPQIVEVDSNQQSKNQSAQRELKDSMVDTVIPAKNKSHQLKALKFGQKIKLQESFPSNEIFILEGKFNETKNQSEFIFCKFIEKKIKRSKNSTDYTKQSVVGDSSSINSLLITDFDDQQYIIPQKVSQYIARQCKDYQLIIDACCGVGGTLVQLAKYSDYCIGVDIDSKRIKQAQDNCKRFNVLRSAEFLNMNFFDLKQYQVKPDLVFLHPTFNDKNNYDLINGCSPNLPQAVSHAYKLSQNVMICLPPNIDLQQIPEIFLNCYKNQVVQEQKTYAIEIQFLNFNKKQYYLISYGKIAKIECQEQTNFMLSKLRQTSGIFDEKIINLLDFLIIKIGVRGVLKYIIKAEKIEEQQNKTILQKFSDLLEQDKIITKKEYQQHFTSNQNGSFDSEQNMPLSPSFNSKLFKHSRESNSFQMNLSQNLDIDDSKPTNKNQKSNSLDDDDKQKQLQQQNSIPKNTFFSDEIIAESQMSNLESELQNDEDSEEDDEQMQSSYIQKKNNSDYNWNASDVQKAKSHDLEMNFFKSKNNIASKSKNNLLKDFLDQDQRESINQSEMMHDRQNKFGRQNNGNRSRSQSR